ncbi:hypothetical protein G6F37_005252 [Rhizopus arrhizus]|nr:hypothetical protein G6F38_002198 [Rhizopus arrhizus]KAG1159041.1 hypothetical protein G6F37_005252 [Rhizopus arrhizus]
MGFSSGFTKFFKKNFTFPEEEKTSSNSTPAGSIYSADSHPGSIIVVSNGFIRDPTRCGNIPDVVGHYYDPMGGKFSLLHGIDPTNTGA